MYASLCHTYLHLRVSHAVSGIELGIRRGWIFSKIQFLAYIAGNSKQVTAVYQRISETEQTFISFQFHAMQRNAVNTNSLTRTVEEFRELHPVEGGECRSPEVVLAPMEAILRNLEGW